MSACGSLVVCEQARELVLFHQPSRVYGAWLMILFALMGVLAGLSSVVSFTLWVRGGAVSLWVGLFMLVMVLVSWRMFLVFQEVVHRQPKPESVILRFNLEDRVAYWADGEVVGSFGELTLSTRRTLFRSTLLLSVRKERFSVGYGDLFSGSLEFVKTQLQRHLEPEFDTLISMRGGGGF